jgi:hypothetical protein
MEGLSPVQISELVTLLQDAITARQRQGSLASGPAVRNQIDHLEAELAWIEWMRENHPDHEESGFPAAAFEEHIQGMRRGIENWQAKLDEAGSAADPNYIESLQSSIEIVRAILEMVLHVRGFA